VLYAENCEFYTSRNSHKCALPRELWILHFTKFTQVCFTQRTVNSTLHEIHTSVLYPENCEFYTSRNPHRCALRTELWILHFTKFTQVCFTQRTVNSTLHEIHTSVLYAENCEFFTSRNSHKSALRRELWILHFTKFTQECFTQRTVNSTLHEILAQHTKALFYALVVFPLILRPSCVPPYFTP